MPSETVARSFGSATPSAAILAGGRARRFGGLDKSRLAIGASRILDRQLATLRAVTDDIVIVAGDPTPFAGRGVRVVADLLPGTGPLGGIYTALEASSRAQVLVVACDMPFLQPAFLRYLADAGRDADIVIPRTEAGYEPLCASYARRAAPALRRRIEAGALKLTDVLADVTVREIGPDELRSFDPHGSLFFNVNTPQDHRQAENLLRRRTR
jgi:molybdenum cofactor guanylyltransferase